VVFKGKPIIEEIEEIEGKRYPPLGKDLWRPVLQKKWIETPQKVWTDDNTGGVYGEGDIYRCEPPKTPVEYGETYTFDTQTGKVSGGR
jgi:hypothetical protein